MSSYDLPRDPLFLVHPRAGAGKAAARLARLLRRAGFGDNEYAVVTIESAADAAAALGRCGATRLPIAAGGDGTVALVATALLDRARPSAALGIVPLGTANLLAHDLGVTDAAAAVRALRASGQRVLRRIDVMRTTHPAAPIALVSISGGFEGRVIQRYVRSRRLGRPVAGLTAFAGAGLRGERIRLELDGGYVLDGSVPTFAAGLYNTRCYAGGLIMSPRAELGDGVCEAYVYRSAREYGRAVLRALRRRLSVQSVGQLSRGAGEQMQWQTAAFECDGAVQIDGETVGAAAFAVSVEPRALAVHLPAG